MNVLAFVLLSTLLLGALWGSASALLYPRLRPGILAVTPTLRSLILWSWSVAPLAMGAFLSPLLFVPYSPLGISHGDHCDKHPACGPHLSQFHLPLPEGASLPEIIALPLLGGCALFFLFQAYTLYRGIHFRRNLRALSRNGIPGARLLSSNRPLALSVGLLRPQVFVSTALLQGLSEEQLQVVLAHEQAHVRRRDGLRKYVAETASLLHLPRTRRLLLSDLSLATEQACDEVATRALGSRLGVAETILAVERLMQPHGSFKTAAMACFFSNHSVARVQSLLDAGTGHTKLAPLLPALPLATVLVALVHVEHLHHGTEWLLRCLLG